MKIIIVLKKQDADGFGGDLLQNMGMVRAKHEPQVFSATTIMHDTTVYQGEGKSPQVEVSNQERFPESHVQRYTEALADYGIRPARVFMRQSSHMSKAPVIG